MGFVSKLCLLRGNRGRAGYKTAPQVFQRAVMNSSAASHRRAIGSYYTPDWLARAVVERCFEEGWAGSRGATRRVIDPACGDGAFVLATLDLLGRVASDRLELVRECLFGVDADPAAITLLRERVGDWIRRGSDSTTATNDEVRLVVERNFVCGNALLGPDWSMSAAETDATGAPPAPVLDWSEVFPHVAAEGGFDLIIGNPPYRRELNAKADFDFIAASPLGQRWRRPRMDLWHYFLHRGLNLLKPGGTICYIVNSYWTGSTAAKPLAARMLAETTLDEVLLFGKTKLFRDVSGRHMVFRARKVLDQTADCRIVDLTNTPTAQLAGALAVRGVSTWSRSVPQSDLWRGGLLRVEPIRADDAVLDGGPLLGDVFDVRQGIAENPPFVTKGFAAELGDMSLVGRGVFVLTDMELAAMRLSAEERSLLRPYFALASIGRFALAPQPSHWLLYLTRQTAPALAELSGLAAHLTPFREMLERRREVRSGSIAWWQLHWPREERLFTSPRVLCVQMGHVPRFVFSERPTFVGFSLNVIAERSSSRETLPVRGSTPSLPALSAILNSRLAQRWFELHAKHRGANLDISGTVLKQFPLPQAHRPELDAKLGQLARAWPPASSGIPGDHGVAKRDAAEAELERLVDEWYREDKPHEASIS